MAADDPMVRAFEDVKRALAAAEARVVELTKSLAALSASTSCGEEPSDVTRVSQRAMTKADLDAIGHCHNPTCPGDHGWEFVQMCHPDSALQASYFSKEGVIEMICAQCGKLVAAAYVASESSSAEES